VRSSARTAGCGRLTTPDEQGKGEGREKSNTTTQPHRTRKRATHIHASHSNTAVPPPSRPPPALPSASCPVPLLCSLAAHVSPPLSAAGLAHAARSTHPRSSPLQLTTNAQSCKPLDRQYTHAAYHCSRPASCPPSCAACCYPAVGHRMPAPRAIGPTDTVTKPRTHEQRGERQRDSSTKGCKSCVSLLGRDRCGEVRWCFRSLCVGLAGFP
jgi:hypothetical protein